MSESISNEIRSYDLTQSQMLMWTGQELNPDSPLYNMILLFDLKGKVNETAFERAFQALLQQCDAMRTVFQVEEGLPRQKIIPDFSYTFEILKESQLSLPFEGWLKERSERLLNVEKCLFDSVLVQKNDGSYYWYFNQHHLITDAWAVSVQYKAMITLYQLALEDKLDQAPTLPLYQEYIAFEQANRVDPTKEAVRTYWKDKLDVLPTPPRLYGYNEQVSTTQNKRIWVDLGAERSAQIRALAQSKEVRSWTQHLSLFNIFSTALYAFLYRISGQRSISIGAPAHNRPTADFKETPGVFIEVFPLLAEIAEGDRFSDLMTKARIESHNFLRYAQPGASYAELNRRFNVVLNYIHAEFEDFNGIPMQSEWVHPNHIDPRHHLRLQVHDFDASGNIQLYFDLNENVFDDSIRDQVPQHFLNLLDAMIEDKDQLIDQPSLLTQENLGQIESFNATAQPIQDTNIVSLFTEQSSISSKETALQFKQQTVSYQDLDSKSNQLAHYLQEKGIGKGDRVAIYLTRSPELLLSIWGILKSGAAYVPIASDYPSDRVSYMLKDAEISLLISTEKLTSNFGGASIPLLTIDKEISDIEACRSEKFPSDISPEMPAYSMYTSGSTGRPKGVVISHGALMNYLRWAKERYVQVERPSFPLFTMIGFDLTVTSLFLPLISGGKLVIYEEAMTGPDLSLLEVMEENAVDVIKLTPSHLALLKDKDCSNSRIKTMIVGGENFKTELAKSIQKAFGTALSIYNEYGPTEATVGCVVHAFDAQKDTQASVPIGQPIANMQAYILDAFLQPVLPGVTGELYMAGNGLADGYWNRTELSAERFVTNPFTENARMYKTGDLVRMDRAGNLEYLGRKDEQVKIGGIRIELGEIESALAKVPGVKQSVVRLYEKSRQYIQTETYCSKCGLPANYPDADYDENGVCHLCRSFENYQKRAAQYFKKQAELQALFEAGKKRKKGEYDCIMLLSGGKDSSYALGKLAEMGLNVLAFTLDNGYISEQAKANIRRVVGDLGVDHVFGQTPAMNAIFVDSLHRHSNVCNGCFKVLYTLSTQIALEKGIPYIVTGLSRGQFFETRLTEELFRDDQVNVEGIDQTILNTRKVYHRVDDAVCRLMDVSMFENDQVFEDVQFVDYYRYTDVSLEEMMEYLEHKLPWVRPTDTGRSTNCLINQVGIYVHKKEEGYNNYAFPYSWDVRIGHKTRDAALEEINEVVDEVEVKRIMEEIGYVEGAANEQQLVAYYVGNSTLSSDELRNHLSKSLPDYMIPVHFQALEEIPLTPNGKVDRSALPNIFDKRTELSGEYIAPTSEIEEMVAEIWEEVLQIERIGIHDNFLALGGHSLAAIRLMARINETFEQDLPLTRVFEMPTIAHLSAHLEEKIMAMLEEME